MSTAPMLVIREARAGRWRPARGWAVGRVVADVDGQAVTFTKNAGWRCRCGRVPCQHTAAVAALIDPDLLAAITHGWRHRPEWRRDAAAQP